MFTVRDRGRPLDFEGKRLGADNSYSDHKGRWFEVQIFKTAGGKYVVAGVGRSRVVHKETCSRVGNTKLDPTVESKTHDNLPFMPCEICKPRPGSAGLVKEQAEKEGLDKIFKAAGFEWREPGCSMCLAMNADRLEPGERCASTSNRNFEGRQGKGGRTHLVSPLVAAATAIRGTLSSPADL